MTDTIALVENTYNFLNSNIGFGLRYDTTTDSKLQLIYNNNAGTQSVQDTNITPVADTLYLITIEYNNSTGYMTTNSKRHIIHKEL